MSTINWTLDGSGDFSDASDWSSDSVPASADDVTIDAATTTEGGYIVTIGTADSEVVNSLTLNAVNNVSGVSDGYKAAMLEIDGTLAFASGSNGDIVGPTGNAIAMNGGTLINAGTIDGSLLLQNNVLITGTNTFATESVLSSSTGTATIDTTALGAVTGNILTSGMWVPVDSTGVIDLGGSIENDVVSIGTISGGSGGTTEVTLFDNGVVNEWDGTSYASLQSTLTELDTGGTLDVVGGGSYVSSQTLSVDGGFLNLQAGTIAPAELDINAGAVQGYATITSNVVNDSTLTATGGTLIVTGNLTGTGQVLFDYMRQSSSYDTTGGTLEVGAVSAGQTITMNGNDTLVLTAPGSFAGTISAQPGDQIVLMGDSVGSADYSNGTLTVYDSGDNTLASLALSGNYAGIDFTPNGSTIDIASSYDTPVISGTAGSQLITSDQTIMPFGTVTITDANTDQAQTENVTVTLSNAANGTLSGFTNGSFASGVYTDSGSASQVTTDLQSLVFTPAAIGSPGTTVATTFTIVDTDTDGQTAADSTTSVDVTVVPATVSWTTGTDGDWTTASDWTPSGVPGATDNVTIDALASTGGYTVTIAGGESETVYGLALNTANNLGGVTDTIYTAAGLEIDGTLAFAGGSTGAITGPNQSLIGMNGGTLINAGQIDGFLLTQSNVLLTGTNEVQIVNTLQDASGTVTIDTSAIYNVSGLMLSGGTFQAASAGSTIDLGGSAEDAVVSIGTIADGSTGPTAVILDDNGAINEWTGTTYEPLQSTLTEIDAGGTLEVLQGGSYVSGNTLSVDGGLLDLQAGTIAPAELDINEGVVQGYATITSNVVNDSTLTALGGTLVVAGTLSGTGAVNFDIDTMAGTTASIGATLEVGAVGSGQAITMNGTDTLVLTAPGSFNGTIAAQVGDQIVLQGDDLGSATYSDGNLNVFDTSSNALASLVLSGNYTGDTFTVNGSTIDVGIAYVPPTITGTVPDQTMTSDQSITPFGSVTIGDTNLGQTETLTVTLDNPANGSLTGYVDGSYASGTYTDIGSINEINEDLNFLVFTPSATGTIGATATTNFTVSVTDTANQSATDTTTSVTETIVSQPYSWTATSSDDWSNASDWATDSVPGQTGDVTIDALANNGPYTVTIASGESEVVNSLTLNATNNASGTAFPIYTAAELAINGTLTFAPGSVGTIAGPVGNEIRMDGGTLVNVGTVNGYIYGSGDVLITGTNGFYGKNFVLESSGTLTIDTPTIDTVNGSILSTGLFESDYAGTEIELGGTLENDSLTIGTIAAASGGQTEIDLYGNGALYTWDGSEYVALQATLTELDNGGTLDVLGGGGYVSGNTLSVDGGLLNLQAGTVSPAELDINGGVVQGYATVTSNVVNDSTLTALGGTLIIGGTLSGTGSVQFDLSSTGTLDPTGAVLEVGTVSAGQTITMNGDDTLVLTSPGDFAGTVSAQALTAQTGDQIVLLGDTIGGAADINGTLVVTDTNDDTLASLALSGNYANDTFVANGSTVTVTSNLTPPTITGTAAGQAVESIQTIAPFGTVTIADPNIGQTETVTVTLSDSTTGILSGFTNGTYNAGLGVYTDTGSASAVTQDLDGLVFTPTVTGSLGTVVQTGFTISDADTGGQLAADSTTTVNTTIVAPTFAWAGAVSGDWSTSADWTPSGVPGAADDVTIDRPSASAAYVVTIGSVESEVVNTLTLNDTNNVFGTIELDGTLAFAPGSSGDIAGPVGGAIHMDGGTLVNVGTVGSFIRAQGNVLITGTNGFHGNDWIQVGNGTVTIDTPTIDTVTGSTLSNGLFEADYASGVIDLGGTLQNDSLTIGTLAAAVNGGTEIELYDNGALNAWNGSAYVSLQATLTEIDPDGTLDVFGGGSFVSSNTLSIDGGLLNLQAGTVAPAELDINAGIVQGHATITSNVVNNSTLSALAGTLVVSGTLSGTGVVAFGFDATAGGVGGIGSVGSIGSTLEAGTVTAGQTIVMNGDDTLVLTAPSAFAGTIAALGGDQIVLLGDTVTSAVDTNGTLVIEDGQVMLAALTLSGDYAGDVFIANGSTVGISTSSVAPTISGTTANQSITTLQTIAPFTGVTISDQNFAQTETLTVTLSAAANGTLSHLGNGSYSASTGIYTDTGSASAVTADLDSLVFTPAATGTLGATATTGFTISDTDTANQAASDTTTSVNVTVVATSTIEASGGTALLLVNGAYEMAPVGGGAGVVLRYNGSPVTLGEFPGAAPVGAEMTSSGYEVAFEDTSDHFIIWNTGSSGNFTSLQTSLLSGTGLALEQAELSFSQDLNNDDIIGPTTSVVSTSTTTALIRIGDEFEFNAAGNTTGTTSQGAPTGPILQYNGAPVTATEFGTASPVAAVQTTSGYEVAFKDSGSGDFIFWNTNSLGVFTSTASSLLVPTSLTLEHAETKFNLDLNNDGTIGPTTTVVSVSNSTSLVLADGAYEMNSASGGAAGPLLKYNGNPVTAGEFGTAAPIAAETTASGYEVVFKDSNSNQYLIWNTNTAGVFTGLGSSLMSSTSTTLEQAEIGFGLDLNNDGTIGPSSTLVSTSATTSTIQFGNEFEFNSAGNTTGTTNLGAPTGPVLTYNGATVTATEFGTAAPIAAVQTQTGYEVMFKDSSSGGYLIWNTNSLGVFTGVGSGLLTPTSLALEQAETTFGLDFNNDGTIGPIGTLVSTSSTTSLVQLGNEYEMNPSGGGSGPFLQMNGAAVTVGEYGTAAPIAAVQTQTGYEVMFKDSSSGGYLIWNTNSLGVFTGLGSGLMTPTSLALEQAETLFNLDFNNDGTIGPVSTVVATSNTTSLVQIGNEYEMNPSGGGTGPFLQMNGAAVTVGEYGTAAPIAAEQTQTGYEVVFKDSSSGSYLIWNTNSSGNFTGLGSGLLTGTTMALEQAETTFNLDLNGDNTIGPVSTTISTSNTASLALVANEYELNPVSSDSPGPILQYNGAAVTTGEFGNAAPIAAIQTSTGFQVVFADTGANQYIVWNTDSNGVFTGLATQAAVTGQAFAIEDLEPTYGLNLNNGSITPQQLINTTTNNTADLTSATEPSVVNLGQNTASASSGLTAPSLTFIGTPNAVLLGSEPAIVEYALKSTSGIETISGFTTGDELNIGLNGALSSTLQAYDTSVGSTDAIALSSTADPAHGIVLLGVHGSTASEVLSNATFIGGHALISYPAQ